MQYLIFIIKKIFQHRYVSFLSNALLIQNIVSLAMLPVLVSWGMPFSTLSWLGNILFLPFLTVYITISSLLFIAFFFNACPQWLLYLHNGIIDLWLVLLEKGKSFFWYRECVFVDSAPYSYIFCWSFLILIIFVYARSKESMLLPCLSSFFALLFCFLVLSCFSPMKDFFIVSDDYKEMLVRYHGRNECFLYLYPHNTRLPSCTSFEYLLLPRIRKYFGIAYPRVFCVK
jgi:hypothetical protein